jgi:ammonium transporter Rh
LGAVGLTMMVTAAGLQWSVFTESFFNQILNNTHDWHYVNINIYTLLNALYAISAVLISFGALIGKISPLQLLTMTIIELLLHSVNFQILMLGVLKLTGEGPSRFTIALSSRSCE